MPVKLTNSNVFWVWNKRDWRWS